MSQVILHDVLCLELHIKEGNKKNAAGLWEKTGVFYKNLILWQFGNEKPAAISASVNDAQLDKIKALPGKRGDFVVDMKLTDTGAKFSFIDVVFPKTQTA